MKIVFLFCLAYSMQMKGKYQALLLMTKCYLLQAQCKYSSKHQKRVAAICFPPFCKLKKFRLLVSKISFTTVEY